MNGNKIEIFKPFGEAFELTKRILFQPFDIKKWFVIGFAAFLASLSGGFPFQGNPFSGWSSRKERREIAESLSDLAPIDQLEWWIIGALVLGGLLLLGLILVLMWLGARGRFMFTDCIVHNRGAIVAPWKEFRVEGNSFFLFSLLVVVVILMLLAAALLPMLLPLIMQGDSARPGVGFWIGFSFFILFVLLLALGWSAISQLMVPIMYRQRCRAREGFAKSIGLIAAHPGPIILYFLFLIVIAIAAAMIGCLATCLTCCIAAIPYIGTVILLPIPVTLYGFALLFLRQFGPDYDVWAGVAEPIPVPPEPPPLPA